MALRPQGVLYISEPQLDRVVARLPDGSFKLIAGTGRVGFSGDGGPAVRARLRQPEGLAVAPDGTLYIADFGNNRVREVLPDGTIETVAGAGGTQPN
jgi:serine/threonine-protein kinase